MFRLLFALLATFVMLFAACKQPAQERKKTDGKQSTSGNATATQTGGSFGPGGNQNEGDLGSGNGPSQTSPDDNSGRDSDDDERENDDDGNDDDREEDDDGDDEDGTSDVETDTDIVATGTLDVDSSEVTVDKLTELTLTDYSDDNYEAGGTLHIAILDKDGDILEETTAAWPAKGQTTKVKDMCNNLGDTDLEVKISGGDHKSPILIGNKWIKKDNAGTDREPRLIVEFQTGFFCLGDCVDDNKIGFKCPKHDVNIDGL